jgi:hypothetical protein
MSILSLEDNILTVSYQSYHQFNFTCTLEHERRSILLVYYSIVLLIPVTRNFRSSKLRKLVDVRGVRSRAVGWAVAHPEFLKKVL